MSDLSKTNSVKVQDVFDDYKKWKMIMGFCPGRQNRKGATLKRISSNQFLIKEEII